MAPPTRVPFTNTTCMLVFHQSNCASAIERMLFSTATYLLYLRVLSCICVLLVTTMHI